MSDKFLESVKEKVKDIRCEVPEEMFDTVWDNVGKRRGWRRRFGIIIAAVAASAAVLAIVLTVSLKESLIPEPSVDTIVATYDPESVSDDAEIVVETVNVRPVPVKQRAINQSNLASIQPSSTNEGNTVAPEKRTTQPEEAKSDVVSGKPHEKESFAQIIEPERSLTRQRKLQFSVSGSTLGTGNVLNRNVPFQSAVAIIHPNKPEEPVMIGNIAYPGNDKVNNISYNHRMPISLRLIFSADISDKLSAEGGVSYSYHNSSVVFNHAESLRQQLHFIGVPIGLRYDFLTFKHSSFYAKIGGEVEKCISGVHFNPTNNYVNKLEFEQLFWSAEASFGVQIKIVDPFFLFAESGCSYHFDNGTGTITYYGAHPLMFSLQGGFRIEL